MSLSSDFHRIDQVYAYRDLFEKDLSTLIDANWQALEDEHNDRQYLLETLLDNLSDLRKRGMQV